MFLNLYEVDIGREANWDHGNVKTILNTERTCLKLIVPGNPEYANSLYNYLVVFEGDMRKWLLLMRYKPKDVSYLTGDTTRLAPLTTENSIDVLIDRNFDHMVFGSRDILIMYFKLG